ncbi:MAG: DUF4405 domain-containing protein [Bacteroidales bacterium]
MKQFQWSAFISVTLLFVFLGLLVSGIVLYIAPEGSLARWIDWQVLGLNKEAWESLHTTLSLLFVLATLFHLLWINGTLLVYYFRQHKYERLPIELLSSIVFFAALLFLSVGSYRPLHALYEGGNYLSDTWEKDVVRPELDEAARLPFREVVAFLAHPVSFKEAKSDMDSLGIEVDNEELPFREVAAANDLSPEALYRKLQHFFAVEK